MIRGLLFSGPCSGGYGWNGPTNIPERIVAAVNAEGKGVIFDRPDDQLELGETPHEYVRTGERACHLCYRDRKTRHLPGWWIIYDHVGEIDAERVAELLAGYTEAGPR